MNLRGNATLPLIFVGFAFFIGFFFLLVPSDAGAQATVLADIVESPFLRVYGLALVSSALFCWCGLLSQRPRFIQLGSMAAFLAFTFSGFVYSTNGAWFQFFTISFVNVLGYAWFFLANNLKHGTQA